MDTKHIVEAWPQSVDQALVGSKYNGADYILDGGSACSRSPNRNMRRLMDDKKANAAASLVSLEVLKEVVTALEGVCDSFKKLADSGDAGNWSFEDTLDYSTSMEALATANDWITKQGSGE